MKTKIEWLEHILFYDLSGNLIPHMCYWVIRYTTGYKREIQGADASALQGKALEYFMKHDSTCMGFGFYGESATTREITYRVMKGGDHE